MKKIAILGSTGSIGTQTLDIVREQKDIEVVALAAGSNITLLEQQIREFSPKLVCVFKEETFSRKCIDIGSYGVWITETSQCRAQVIYGYEKHVSNIIFCLYAKR